MDTNMDLTQDSPISAELIDLVLDDIPPVLSPHRPDHESVFEGSSFEDKDTEGVAMGHTMTTNPVTSDILVLPGYNMLRKPARRSGQGSFFMIEKIIGHRFKHDREEVLIKWKNYDVTHNSWEPVSNLNNNSLGLLEIYKARQAQGLDDTGPIRMDNEGASSETQLEPKPEVSAQEPMDNVSEVTSNVEVTGFDDPTKEFDAIMGMTEPEGELYFLISFKANGQDSSFEVIPANLKIPIQVIDYYEARLCYNAE